MSDDVKIPVSVPGAKQAVVDLKDLSKALNDVFNANVKGSAESAKGHDTLAKGAKEASKGARETKDAFRELGSSLGVNTNIFSNWKLGVAAAVTTGIALVGEMIHRVGALREEFRRNYEEFIQFSRQPTVAGLARVRGVSEATVTRSVLAESKSSLLPREEVLAASVPLEQILSGMPAGDMSATRGDVLQFMRTHGVSGEAASGLVGEAVKEVGLSRVGIQSYLGKAAGYGQASRMGVRGLTSVVGEMMGPAVAAGFTPERIMAIAAAMSKHASTPEELRSRLRQVIMLAGRRSKAMDAFAQSSGRRSADLSADEIVRFQMGIISGAGGPQELSQLAAEMGIPARGLAGLVDAFGPETQAAADALQAGSGSYSFGNVQAEFQKIAKSPEGRLERAGESTRNAALTAGDDQVRWAQVIKIGEEKRIQARKAGSYQYPWVTDERDKRIFAAQALDEQIDMALNELDAIGKQAGEDPTATEAKREALGALRPGRMQREKYTLFGAGEGAMIKAADAALGVTQPASSPVNTFQGGTHFHGVYEDRAAVHQTSGME